MGQGSAKQERKRKLCAGFPGAVTPAVDWSRGFTQATVGDGWERMGPRKAAKELGFHGEPQKT